MQNKLQQRAFDIAMEGRSEAEAKAQLVKDFPGEDATGEQINAAVYYAYRGGDAGTSSNPLHEGGFTAASPEERAKVANYCKRAARKAKVMLRVNYKECEDHNISDCVADLLHLCNEKGWDFTELAETGRNHFNAELLGGEHG